MLAHLVRTGLFLTCERGFRHAARGVFQNHIRFGLVRMRRCGSNSQTAQAMRASRRGVDILGVLKIEAKHSVSRSQLGFFLVTFFSFFSFGGGGRFFKVKEKRKAVSG